jgi:transcriptional regulator with XRE-family HTH domain
MAGKQQNTTREALVHLHSWRASREWTLKDLAIASGLTIAALSHLETGRTRANALTVTRLAKAFGIPRRRLLEEEPPESSGEVHSRVGEVVASGR